MQRGDPDQLLRTNQRTNERYVAILCRVEDAALKFRGCFQAICELRSEHQQGEDRPEGGVPADRAWSSLNLSIHPSSAHLSHPPLIRVRLSPSHSFPSFRLFQLPLTFSPTFTASSRFAPWLGHPLFAPHTEAQRNEQSPLRVLLVHLGSPNPSSPIGKIDFLLLPRNVKEEKAYVEIINDKFEDRNNFSIHTCPPESLLPKISVR